MAKPGEANDEGKGAPAQTGEGAAAVDADAAPTLQLLDRNKSVMDAIIARRRAEFEVEAGEIGSPEQVDDDRDTRDDRAPSGELIDRQQDTREGATDDEASAEPVGGARAGDTDAPTDDELVDVVVDGKRFRVDAATVEDAGGVEAYQKQRAATARLDEASRIRQSAESRELALRDRAIAMGLDPDTLQPKTAATTQQSDSGGRPKTPAAPAADAELPEDVQAEIARTSKSISLAASDEELQGAITGLVKKLVAQPAQQTAAPAEDQIEAVINRRETRKASHDEMAAFMQENPDIANSPAIFGATRFIARQAMIEDMLKLPNLKPGAPEMLAAASDAQIGQWHLNVRQEGNGRSLKKIFDDAAGLVRRDMKLPKPSPTTESKDAPAGAPRGERAPSPVSPAVLARRRALKGAAAVATSTPSSSATAPPRAQSETQSQSAYIQQMRKARGLPVNSRVH